VIEVVWDDYKMRFGKISATLLIIAGSTLIVLVLCRPG